MASLQALRDILVVHRFSVVDDPNKKSDGVPKWSRHPKGGFMLHRDYVVRTPEEAMALLTLYLEDKLGTHVASTAGRERELLESEKLPLRAIGAQFLDFGAVDMDKLTIGANLTKLAWGRSVDVGCGGAKLDLKSVDLQIRLLNEISTWTTLPMEAIAASDFDNSQEGQTQDASLMQQLNDELQSGEYKTFMTTLTVYPGKGVRRAPVQSYLLARRLALQRNLPVSHLETWSALLYKLIMDTNAVPAPFCGDVNEDWLKFLEKFEAKGASVPAKKELRPNVVIEEGWAGALVHGLLVSFAPVGLAAGYMPPKTISLGLKAFSAEGVPHPGRTLEVLLNERLDKAEAALDWWAKSGKFARENWDLPFAEIVMMNISHDEQ